MTTARRLAARLRLAGSYPGATDRSNIMSAAYRADLG